MSEPERAHPPSSRLRPWLPAQSAKVLIGVLAVAGVMAAYYWVHLGGGAAPATPQSAPDAPLRLHEPRALPDIVFEDGQGRKRTLGDFRGRVVLLNVWATWCVPCREEMPTLDRLQQKLGGPDFEVLALSIDADGAAAVERFYGEIGIRALATYVDSTMRATGSLAVIGVPTTLLIDRGGREIGRRAGPVHWDSPEAVRLIVDYTNAAAKR
jgi:thiol-disulfide isomerase/thioredoxin